MSQSQPDQDNTFQYNRRRLQQAYPGAEVRFQACEITIDTILTFLKKKLEWEIKEADLWDYAYALRDIRICLYELSDSDTTARYPYSKILDPLQRAIRELGETLRPRNVYAGPRSTHIQEFIKNLNTTLQLMKALGHPPP